MYGKKGMKLAMILDEIVMATKMRVEREKQCISYSDMKQKAMDCMLEGKGEIPFLLEEVLKQPGVQFICEIKRASPSKGLICEEFDPTAIAKEYEAIGADAISVLTEPKFFGGSNEDFTKVVKGSSLPVLRKDFIVDAYQIYEAKTIKASCVLLICSILQKQQLQEYLCLCDQLQLSALVEVHNEREIEMALQCGARIIGVNNRNLDTFTTDVSHCFKLRSYVPKHQILIAESGIHTADDIKRCKEAGISGVLIGEAFMKSNNRKKMMLELRSGSK